MLVAACWLAAALAPHSAPASESATTVAQAISILRSIGALSGFPGGDMRLSKPVTKEQFAAIFGRALGRSSRPPFPARNDTRLLSATISAGPAPPQAVTPSVFETLRHFAFAGLRHPEPKATLTHEEAIVAAMRYAAAAHRIHPRGFPLAYPRVSNDSEISFAARPYVYQALVLNLVRVDERNRVQLAGEETRAEAAVIAARLVDQPVND